MFESFIQSDFPINHPGLAGLMVVVGAIGLALAFASSSLVRHRETRDYRQAMLDLQDPAFAAWKAEMLAPRPPAPKAVRIEPTFGN